MARLLTSGFETGSLEEFNGGSKNVSVQDTFKRTGDYALKLNSASVQANAGRIDHTFAANETEIFFRFALYIDEDDIQSDWNLLTFYDEAHTGQVTIKFASGTQTLDVYRSTDTLLAAGSVVLRAEIWNVIQGRLVIDDSSGVATITVNNTASTGFSGDTQATAVASVRSLRFAASSVSPYGSFYIDDVAFNDTSGSYQASWPGLGGVYILMPDAEGTTQDFTPSTGTVHWSLVDEKPANTTDWVQALGTGNVELYEKEDTPTYIETINLVEVVYQAAVIDSGYNEIETLIRQDATNYSAGGTTTIIPIVNDYTLYKGNPQYVQPNGSGAWGTAEVNAVEFGFQIPG